jgi:hypothetical protein
MTTVTLLIFSGRPDPIWELTPGEVAELVPQLREFEPAAELSNLGYRGFLVHSDDPGVSPTVIVRQSPELERFLLRTGERHLPPEIIRLVEQAIE